MTGKELGKQPTTGLESGCSYVLRLWRQNPDDPWQGELQHVVTGELHRFSSLDDIVAFLRDEDAGASAGHDTSWRQSLEGPKPGTRMDDGAQTKVDQ